MATGNKQAGEWMSPKYGDIDYTMKCVADLRTSKPHGPDDTSWNQDDCGFGHLKPGDLTKRERTSG